VDRSSQESKDYLQEYEDQRAIVEALSAAEQAEPGNKSKIDILGLRSDGSRQPDSDKLRLFLYLLTSRLPTAMPFKRKQLRLPLRQLL
jgi:hypothetical protein